jgi:hypothetical protein
MPAIFLELPESRHALPVPWRALPIAPSGRHELTFGIADIPMRRQEFPAHSEDIFELLQK